MRFSLILATFAAAAALLATSCAGNGDNDSPTGSPPAAGSPSATLSFKEMWLLGAWGERVCALAVEVADTLDVPDTESQGTLAERKQWVAEIVAPRVEELALIEEDIAILQPPDEVVEFSGSFTNYHDAFRRTVNIIAGAWQALVDTVGEAQSAEEVDTASVAFARAKQQAMAEMLTFDNAYLVSREMKDALSQPKDCGFLH